MPGREWGARRPGTQGFVPAKTALPPAVAALLDVGLGLVRRAPSARLAIVRAGGILDPEALTDPVRDAVEAEVEAARAAVCVPLAAKEVEQILKAAWAGPPAKVLDAFEAEPFALTAAAQLHRGQYDGTPVVVKVRRPGIERSVRNDLVLLDALAAPLRSAFGNLDATAILRDVREQALDELDFEHEASTQRRVARALRGVDGVTVPRPLLDLSTSEVLVSERAEGTTLADGARPADAGAAARALIGAFRAAVLEAGLAPVDLRASHVVVGPGDELALLGMGVSRPIDRERAERALDVLDALAAGEADAFGARVAESGVLGAEEATAAHGVLRDVAGPLVDGPAVLDADAIRELGVRAWRAAPTLASLATAAAPHPEDLALGRMLGQLVAVLSRLGAREDWATLTR
jgi:hypothetical protein